MICLLWENVPFLSILSPGMSHPSASHNVTSLTGWLKRRWQTRPIRWIRVRRWDAFWPFYSVCSRHSPIKTKCYWSHRMSMMARRKSALREESRWNLACYVVAWECQCYKQTIEHEGIIKTFLGVMIRYTFDDKFLWLQLADFTT